MSRISSAISSSPLSPQPVSWPVRRTQTELQRFLHDTKAGLHDSTWLGHARRAYRLSAHADIKVTNSEFDTKTISSKKVTEPLGMFLKKTSR